MDRREKKASAGKAESFLPTLVIKTFSKSLCISKFKKALFVRYIRPTAVWLLSLLNVIRMLFIYIGGNNLQQLEHS